MKAVDTQSSPVRALLRKPRSLVTMLHGRRYVRSTCRISVRDYWRALALAYELSEALRHDQRHESLIALAKFAGCGSAADVNTIALRCAIDYGPSHSAQQFVSRDKAALAYLKSKAVPVSDAEAFLKQQHGIDQCARAYRRMHRGDIGLVRPVSALASLCGAYVNARGDCALAMIELKSVVPPKLEIVNATPIPGKPSAIQLKRLWTSVNDTLASVMAANHPTASNQPKRRMRYV